MFERLCHWTSLIHILQVDVVCHGQTPVMADVDGSDPYAVSLYITKTCPCNKQRFFSFKKWRFSAEKM